MRTLQEKYNAILEGNFSEAQFVRDARLAQPNLITQYNGFSDTVQILKNKGMIAEVAKKDEPKYSTAKPEDLIAPDVLDTGIKFELDKKFGTLDVSDEDYNKAKETAIKNLSKDVLYYVKQDSIQLDTPKEKMEKVKLNEEVDSKAIVAKMVPIIQDYLAAGGDRGAARDIMDDLKNGRNLHVYADIENVEDLKDQLDYEYSYSDDLSDLEETQEVTEGDYEPRTKEDLVFQYLRDAWQLGALKGKDFNPDQELSTMADSLITYLPDYDTAESASEPDVEDLYQHDPEYLAQLKESIKKIIAKVITE